MEKLIKNTIVKTYCLKLCCQGTPKRAVHAEGGAVSINTKVKSEDTEITDSRNRRHISGAAYSTLNVKTMVRQKREYDKKKILLSALWL